MPGRWRNCGLIVVIGTKSAGIAGRRIISERRFGASMNTLRKFAAGDGMDPFEAMNLLARIESMHELLVSKPQYDCSNPRPVRFTRVYVTAEERSKVDDAIKALKKPRGTASELDLRCALFRSYRAYQYWRATWHYLPSSGLGRTGSKARSLARDVAAIIQQVSNIPVQGADGTPPLEYSYSPDAIVAAMRAFVEVLPRNTAKQKRAEDDLDVERVTKSFKPLAAKIRAVIAKLNTPQVRNRIYLARALATGAPLSLVDRVETEQWRAHCRNRDFITVMLRQFAVVLEVAERLNGKKTNVRAYDYLESVCAPLVEYWIMQRGKLPRLYDHPTCF